MAGCIGPCEGRSSDEESIVAFKERVQGMIAAVCAEEFVARPSYMGCRNCDYGDLCEVGEKE